MEIIPLIEIPNADPNTLGYVQEACTYWREVTNKFAIALGSYRLDMYEWFRTSLGYARRDFHMWIKPPTNFNLARGTDWLALNSRIMKAKPRRLTDDAWRQVPKTLELETILANKWFDGFEGLHPADVVVGMASGEFIDDQVSGGDVSFYPACTGSSNEQLHEAIDTSIRRVSDICKTVGIHPVTDKYSRCSEHNDDGTPKEFLAGAYNSNWRASAEGKLARHTGLIYNALAVGDQQFGYPWAWPCSESQMPLKAYERDGYKRVVFPVSSYGFIAQSKAIVEALTA